MAFFSDARAHFRFDGASWRKPQLGALGALLAHWSLDPSEPALIALPTGTGKTGIALAAPFLTATPPRRVLVLVPSAALRDHLTEQFRSLDLLKKVNALVPVGASLPRRVEAIEGYQVDWRDLESADVVVAIPQSISPAATGVELAVPRDMFDLVIVDEAHHTPATTWRAVLDHVDFAHAVLLTATPFRLDRKPVPGTRAYHYPLRNAINEGFYKPIEPRILPAPEPFSEAAKDAAILDYVVGLLNQPRHASSALMIRSRTKRRAEKLAALYRENGIDVSVLHSGLQPETQDLIRKNLISGSVKAVSVVGMLGEGFDLPSLRLVAYHDKHKSMPATVQLIGRLARVDSAYPQESVLVTVDDTEVYPELAGVVSRLYQEDADWATILPGIVDEEVRRDRANREFTEPLRSSPSRIDPTDLRPMPTPTIFELPTGWQLPQGSGNLPVELRVGELVAGARILFAEATSDGSMVVLVTRKSGPPRWYSDPSLESVSHNVNVLSFRPTPQTDLPSLLFVDCGDAAVEKALLDILETPEQKRPVASDRLDGYLESLPRTSVSMIGMRNILAGTRGTSYKTRAGRSTDTDLQSTETSQTALGHVMMVINTDDGSTTVGGAFEKGKLWQRRYMQLVDYSDWISEAAELLWFPRRGSGARLIPQVSRGRTLVEFPDAQPLATEMHPGVRVGGFILHHDGQPVGAIEDLELHVGVDPTGTLTLPPHSANELPCVAVIHQRESGVDEVCWTGTISVNGSVAPAGHEIDVFRGVMRYGTMSEFLEHYPPIVYFFDGQVSQGTELFDVRGSTVPEVDPRLIVAHDWTGRGTNIRAETEVTAQKHIDEERGEGHAVHTELEQYLRDQPRRRRHRWIINNDGSGEIADYVVIEYAPQSPLILSLWHAKPAGGSPSLRVEDFQVVVGQAMRSRSWFNDPALWQRLRLRLIREEAPTAHLAAGSDSIARLLILLGQPIGTRGPSRRSWPQLTPVMKGEIAVAQPGLSRDRFVEALPGTSGETVTSLRQLFSLLSDTVAVTGNLSTILSSP